MRNFINKRKVNIVNAVIGALLFMFVPMFGEYFYNAVFTSQTEVFEYTKTESAKQIYFLGEKPRLYSTAIIKKTSAITWNDTLYCTGPDHGGYVYFSEYTTQKDRVESITWLRNDKNSGGWLYQGGVPTIHERECYVDSVITARIGKGFLKNEYQQQILSGPFTFVNPIVPPSPLPNEL